MDSQTSMPSTETLFERTGENTMIVNMGPQHPSTHGVLRVICELDGETIVQCKCLGALGRLDKNVSGLRVQLAEPTLGITLADGQVAFPAGSLLLRVDAQLKGSTHTLIENGAETFWLRNPTPIVGRLVDGSLDLKMDAAAPFGTVRIETKRTQ